MFVFRENSEWPSLLHGLKQKFFSLIKVRCRLEWLVSYKPRLGGFNRGLGGSMHAFFAPFGIYPNNAIVGGSGSIAPGAALFKRVNR